MEYYSAIKRNELGSFVEMWMDLGRNRHRCREQMYGRQRGKVGGGMNWEIGIDIYTLICIK